MKKSAAPRLGIVFWYGQDHGRKVLLGAADYAERAGLPELRAIGAEDLSDLTAKVGLIDGLIVALNYETLRRIPKPLSDHMVLVPRHSSVYPVLSAAPDSRAIARRAVEYLRSLRLERLTLFTDPGRPSDELEAGFRDAAADATVDVCPLTKEGTWFDWFDRTSFPCGALCQSESRAAWSLLHECEARGVRVPEDVAVIGVGNDPVIDLVSHPTLSSVAVPSEELGRRAAEMLHRKLCGEAVESILVPPEEFVERRSTKMFAIEDQAVAVAVVYLREWYLSRVSTADVARHVGLARRTLETRFAQAMGCSVQEEVRRLRLERVTWLMTHTDMPIKAIAAEVGMLELTGFNAFVKRETGLSPTAYRNRLRSS